MTDSRKDNARMTILRWISATVNKYYSNDKQEGLDSVQRGNTVVLLSDGTWYKS